MKTKKEILRRLEATYQGAVSELHFQNAYELLVATVLAAQCTDARVNRVTPALFQHYPDAKHLAKAKIEELTEEIKSCGCYRVKAANLLKTAGILAKEYDGQVPKTMEELTKLPGVGRKTANVVLANAFNIPGFAVDTHVFRVSNRLGLAHGDDVRKVEDQLCALVPKAQWKDAHHWLIYHGRRVCHARKPNCPACFLNDICPYPEKTKEKREL